MCLRCKSDTHPTEGCPRGNPQWKWAWHSGFADKRLGREARHPRNTVYMEGHGW